MEVNLRKEQLKKRLEKSLKNNLKKRKIFQSKIKKKIQNNK
tara:strand:+ start:341 stop:463 length:123 start_codon:yes stop_codon:yes gene_type:complete